NLFNELWDSLAATIEALEQAGPEADAALVKKLAHDACGLSASLGASALSAALRRIEHAARDGAASADLFDGLGPLSADSRSAAAAVIARRSA
ncbi:MAG: Hpt domain-containing protein, partial [Amphiplicatus sp.]